MFVENIEAVAFVVILLFGLPVLWNANKNGLFKEFNFIKLIITINKSLILQGLIAVVLILLTWLFNLSDLASFIGGITYTYIVIWFFMYLPIVVFLNTIKLLILYSEKKQ